MKCIQLYTMVLAFMAGCGSQEPPRALTQRELANVTAFANALGYIRFFHPTDAAVGVNWDAFAIRAMRTVELATSDDSLAAALSLAFAPITSNVRFARTGGLLPTTIAKPTDATHVVFWRHLGVGVPSGSGDAAPNRSYRSERVVAPLSKIGRPITLDSIQGTVVSLPPVPDPSHPVIAELGGGVSMSMPIGLFTNADFVEESMRVPNASPVLERFSASDRATRLADVALAWSLFAHFYPYFDLVHTNWPAALAAALRSAATDSDGDAFLATLQRLVAALHDGHGAVLTKSVALQTHDVRFTWVQGHVLVAAMGDSAAASGLRVGDEVLAVDDQPVQAKLDELSTRISGATAQWIRSRALNMLLDGDPRVSAVVRVSSAQGVTRALTLARTPNDTVRNALDSIAEVSPRVMYVDLSRVSEAQFDAVLPRLQQAKAVIFDVRRYPNMDVSPHLTDTVIHSARFMIPVITEPNYRNVGYIDASWNIAPAAPRLRARAIFLSGPDAISGAETVLGTVEANRLGDIVGEPSAGTNGNVNPFILPGGYAVTWTGMLVQKRAGTPHHGVGVLPTVPVSPTIAGIRAGRDEVLERALSLVTTVGGR